MKEVLRELSGSVFARVRLIVWAAVTVICVLSGPFRSAELLILPERISFWGMITAIAIIWANVVLLASKKLIPQPNKLVASGLESIVFGLGFALVLKALISTFYPLPKDVFAPIWYLFAQAVVFYLAVAAVKYIISREKLPEVQTPLQDPTFLKRLPDELGKSLMRVSGQNHHIEVQTEAGQDRILMRFTDALDELEGLGGMRVHRSHWVCQSAVVGAVQENGKVILTLKGGTQVPVSRSYRDAALEAGLF